MNGVEFLFAPGGVHELRALKVSGRKRTDSGYFDSAGALAVAAVDLAQVSGSVYMTINPVNPALLARSPNVVTSYAETTTPDHDIACRRWLFVDLDPKRPTGIASTDDEHAAAHAKAAQIIDALTAEGWPYPAAMDSGNGAALFYRIELPNDDASLDLIKRCLAALGRRFGDAVVSVDQTGCNAARIIRVPGTVNRKGHNTADRPHRAARMLSNYAPDVVPVELLQALAASTQPEPAAPAQATSPGKVDQFMNPANPGGGYDVNRVLEHLDVIGSKRTGDRETWIVVCPFNPDHTDNSAWVTRYDNGALSAGCQHNSCKGQWAWAELRAMYDPKPARKPRAASGGAPGAEMSDSVLAESIADDVLSGRYVWAEGLGWLAWDGRRWAVCSEATVGEPVRLWAIDKFTAVAASGDLSLIKESQSLLSLGKQRAALTLARGIVERKVDELDANPDLLNTPGGVVDMRTGQIGPHDPGLLLTKITSGSYRPGFTHLDWVQALTALPDDDTRRWMQARIGQGATGHRSPDGVNVIMQGGGENGKGSLGSDGVVPALGDYATLASHKLIADTNEHSEEQATLRGKRLIIAEELTEKRALNVTAIKRISDVASITARHVHQRNMTFKTTHTLFATTNYVPVVEEVDHGTWRRLALCPFPFTFRKPHEALTRPTDRPGDPGLKDRIERNVSGQHDAIVTWVVDGARRWYADGSAALAPPPAVARATDAWRATADRIVGFWRAQLVADSNAGILADEMLDAFNAWLLSNNHNRWAKETFAPRFGGHVVTTGHGVEQRRTRVLTGLSRWPVVASPFPTGPGVAPRALKATEYVWRGVRFRTAGDLDEPGGDDQQDIDRTDCTDPLQTFPTRSDMGNLQTPRHSQHSQCVQDQQSIDCDDCRQLAKYGAHMRCYRHSTPLTTQLTVDA